MPHSLGLALWLSGQAPVRVYATGVRGLLAGRGVPTWDAIDAVVTLADGSTVALHSSWILPESYPGASAVARFRFRGKQTLLLAMMATQAIPASCWRCRCSC